MGTANCDWTPGNCRRANTRQAFKLGQWTEIRTIRLAMELHRQEVVLRRRRIFRSHRGMPALGIRIHRTGRPLASGVILALLLGVAALVLSIIGVAREPTASPPPSQAEEQELFVKDADKALCEVIGPLMQEETDRGKAFLNSGEPASAERKAAVPKFKSETSDWANRIRIY